MSNNNPNRDLMDYLGPFILIAAVVFGGWFLLKPYLLKFMFYASPALFKFAIHYVPNFLLPSSDRLMMADAIRQIPLLNQADIIKTKAWHYFWMMASLWGTIFRIVIIPLLLAQLYVWIKNVPARIKYRYVMSMRDLALQNAQQYPCVLPAIRANLSYKDPYTGTWKYPLSVVEFVMKHGMLIYKQGQPNQRHIPAMGAEFARMDIKQKRKIINDYMYVSLDVNICDAVMTKQLGKRWRGLDALPPLERALAVCLMAASLGGKLNKKAFAFLDQISRTFVQAKEDEKGNITGESSADLSGINELRLQVEKHKHILKLVSSHAYEKTVFIRLLDRRYGGARAKGKLTPTLFHWLKPHNEELWRVLHAEGGQEPWIEGLAPWIHYHNEISLKRAINQPVIESASESIIACLHEEQWLYDKKLGEAAEIEAAETLAMLNNQGKR